MLKDRGWIAYVGPFHFPWGQPGSRRVYGIARSLAASGHDVVVASGQHGPSTPIRLEEVEGQGSVSHLGLGELPAAGAGRLARSVQFLLRLGQRTAHWLDAQPTKPSHVVVYGGGAQYMVQLRRWCRRNRIALVADVVEWYDPWHLRGGFLGPLHLSTESAIRYYYPRCDGIIAISSFLEAYYRGRGTRVLRVPPTLDVQNLAVPPAPLPTTASGLSLVYSGTPGKKDLLADIIRAIDRADPEGGSIELRVHGPSPQEVRCLLGGEVAPRGVRVLGRLPQQEVSQALQSADFSVLIRRSARFSQAGFPTKFCESLANGTPVIANLTSDLGRYLSDGEEGLVCRDHSVDALAETLRTAQRMDRTKRTLMRKAARARALDSFDFRTYANPIGRFFDAIAP